MRTRPRVSSRKKPAHRFSTLDEMLSGSTGQGQGEGKGDSGDRGSSRVAARRRKQQQQAEEEAKEEAVRDAEGRRVVTIRVDSVMFGSQEEVQDLLQDEQQHLQQEQEQEQEHQQEQHHQLGEAVTPATSDRDARKQMGTAQR